MRLCSSPYSYSLNCHGDAVLVFHKFCRIRTAQSSRAHSTESVSVMGHAWLAAVCSTGSDQRRRSFFVHISSFWNAVLPDCRVLRNGDVSDLQMQILVLPSQRGRMLLLKGQLKGNCFEYIRVLPARPADVRRPV